VAKPLTGKRCLVVDDEFLIALDIQQVLEQAGAAEAVCTGNAAEALTALRAGRFDFAVLDLRLGHGGGTSLPIAEALAAAGTPFIFLTGLRGDSAEARAFPRRARGREALWRQHADCRHPAGRRRTTVTPLDGG
jgi:CheY-like chemotaxis protein